jgi:hypothetical protein
MWRRALLLLLALPVFPKTVPSDFPRMRICINGNWEAILNQPGDRIPESGWTSRRAPELPIATNPPTTSKLFAQLYTKYTKQAALPQRAIAAAEFLVKNVAPGEAAPTTGVLAADDGTAWLFAPVTADYPVVSNGGIARRIR